MSPRPSAPRLALVSLLAALACGPVPGGRLRGETAPPPQDWTAALDGDRRMCEVESRPGDPHSIQLECFLVDGALHAQSHRFALADWWPVESWAAIWIREPDVRVRVGGRIYDLRAVQVTDPTVRERILRARGYDPVPAGIVLFRFEPRTSAATSSSAATGPGQSPSRV
jgi:hypothetical protein